MKHFLLPVFMLMGLGLTAQNVGVGTNAPHPSAKLDISANADPSARGLLIPQMNLASASFPAPGPATSLLVYNTNASFGGGVGYFYNEGTPASPVWRRLTNGSNAVGSVAASAPITSSGGVNPTISIPQANGTTDGFLDAADWTTFNNKVSGVAASAPITSTGGVNPTIGIPQATAAVDGFLDAADWNTFNNKLTTVTTNPRLTGLGTSGNPLDMAIVGTAGTYTKVTTDAYGRVVSAGALAPGDLPTGSGNYIQNQFASGQSGSFWINGQGKFGNGTTVYGDRMEVREGVNGNGFAYIDFRGDDNFTDFGLRLIRGNTGANAVSELVHRGSGNLNITAQDNGVIALNTSNVERMRVSATQPFVGIGTNSPQHNLTLGSTGVVFGVENTASFSAKNSAGNYEIYMWPRFSDNVMYMNYGSAGFNIRNNASTSAMFMTNAGLVGVGTTAPAHRLDVAGDANVSGTYRMGSTNVIFGNSGDVYGNIRVLQNNSTALPDGMYINYNSTGGAAADLRFFANGTAERMTIKANTGNVGIGTNNPQATLNTRGTTLFQNASGGQDTWFPFVDGNNYISANNTFIRAANYTTYAHFNQPLGGGGNRMVYADNNGTVFPFNPYYGDFNISGGGANSVSTNASSDFTVFNSVCMLSRVSGRWNSAFGGGEGCIIENNGGNVWRVRYFSAQGNFNADCTMRCLRFRP